MRYDIGDQRAQINTAGVVYHMLRNSGAAGTACLEVLEVSWGIGVAFTTAPLWQLVRLTTALGTPSVTATDAVPRDAANSNATPAGVLDTTFTVQPTITSIRPIRAVGMNTASGGFFVADFRDRPIILPPGAALALANANASGGAGQAWSAWTWEE